MPKKTKKRTGPTFEYSPNDCITLKGAAAQQTTQPGNLLFYKLCEDRYSEFQELGRHVDHKLLRTELCATIVKEFQKVHNGRFLKHNGKVMDDDAAIEKARDRMRQIGKPKIVCPKSIVGDHDVVFTAGSRNHLFPGNPKFRALVDTYVPKYWPELFIEKANAGKKVDPDTGLSIVDLPQPQPWVPGSSGKPDYQEDILEELIRIIEQECHGKFMDGNYNVLGPNESSRYIHQRFKDIKKLVRAGKFKPNPGNVEDYILTKSGHTSTQKIVEDKGADFDYATAIKQTKRNFDENGNEITMNNGNDDDEETSNAVAMIAEGNNKKKEEDAQARSQRLERRRQLQPPPPPPRKKKQRLSVDGNTLVPNEGGGGDSGRATRPPPGRRRRPRLPRKNKYKPTTEEEKLLFKSEEEQTIALEKMNEYEKLRFENMKRNHNRLKELGLDGGVTEWCDHNHIV